MDNKKLGLYRLTTMAHQHEVEASLSTDFADVYDALDDVRANLRAFEKDLNTILYGERMLGDTV